MLEGLGLENGAHAVLKVLIDSLEVRFKERDEVAEQHISRIEHRMARIEDKLDALGGALVTEADCQHRQADYVPKKWVWPFTGVVAGLAGLAGFIGGITDAWRKLFP